MPSPLPIGNIVITASAGIATKAIRDDCSPAAETRMSFKVTWVNHSRKFDATGTQQTEPASARIAAPKSPGLLNDEETLSGISGH